jgi:hypothetical protein
MESDAQPAEKKGVRERNMESNISQLAKKIVTGKGSPNQNRSPDEIVAEAKDKYKGVIPRIELLQSTFAVLGVDFNTVIFVAKDKSVTKNPGDPWTIEEVFGMAAADPKSPFYDAVITRDNLSSLQDEIKTTIRDTARNIFLNENSFRDAEIVKIILDAISVSYENATAKSSDDGLGGGGRRKYKQRGGNVFTDVFNSTIGISMTVITFSWGMLKGSFSSAGNKIANLRVSQAIVRTWNDPSNNLVGKADEYLATQVPKIPGLLATAATAGVTTIGEYLSSLDRYDWSLLFLMGIYTYGGTPFLIDGFLWALSYAPGGIVPGFLGESMIVKMIDVFLTYKVGSYGFALVKYIVQKGVNGCVRVYNAGGMIADAIHDRFAGATEAQLQTAGSAFDSKLQALLAKIRGHGNEPLAVQIPRVAAELNTAAGETVDEAPVARVQSRQRQITAYIQRTPRASSTSASLSTSNAAGNGGQGGARRRRHTRKHRSRRHRRSTRQHRR